MMRRHSFDTNDDRQASYPHAFAHVCVNANGSRPFSSKSAYTRAQVIGRGFCSYLNNGAFCCSKRLLYEDHQMCRRHHIQCRKRLPDDCWSTNRMTPGSESENWRPRQILHRNSSHNVDIAVYQAYMEHKKNIRRNIKDLPGVDADQIEGAVDFLAHMWLQRD